MTWTVWWGLGGRKYIRFTRNFSTNLPGVLGKEAGRFYYLFTAYMLSSPWGFAWFSETSFKGQARRPKKLRLGVLDDLHLFILYLVVCTLTFYVAPLLRLPTSKHQFVLYISKSVSVSLHTFVCVIS